MSRRSIELVHGRSRVVVVPRSQVAERLTMVAARGLVEDALREGGPSAAAALERLAEALVWRPIAGSREAAQIVAEGLVEGRIVAVTLSPATGPLADAEVTDLRMLGGWPDDPLHPPGEPPAPAPTEPTTWISFEVVDERGVPADGRFRLALDGRTEHDALARRRHRFEALLRAGPAELEVQELRWDEPAPGPHVPGPSDAPAEGGLLSIELVDDRGEPLVAHVRLSEGDHLLLDGTLAHRLRRALPAGGPVTLELTELRTRGGPP